MSTKTAQTDDACLGRDLASVACNAAIELDNFLRGATVPMLAVGELCDKLTEEVPNVRDLSEVSRVNFRTALLLHRVLRESQTGLPCQNIYDLARQVAIVVGKLLAVSNRGVAHRSSDEESVKALRTFSLLLSRYSCAV